MELKNNIYFKTLANTPMVVELVREKEIWNIFELRLWHWKNHYTCFPENQTAS
jgi:hypothetical protein